MEKDFFNTGFSQPQEKLVVLNGLLSQQSNQQIQRKISHIAKEFNELMQQDHSLPINERDNNTLVLAVRPWQYAMFDQYKRKNSRTR